MYLWKVRKLYINNEVMATGMHWNGRLESCSDKEASNQKQARQARTKRAPNCSITQTERRYIDCQKQPTLGILILSTTFFGLGNPEPQ
jgi:hypothetical protein